MIDLLLHSFGQSTPDFVHSVPSMTVPMIERLNPSLSPPVQPWQLENYKSVDVEANFDDGIPPSQCFYQPIKTKLDYADTESQSDW